MSQSPKPLYQLLTLLFVNNDALYEFLVNYNYINAIALVNSLPATTVSRVKFTMDSVQQLQAHGLDKASLFDELTSRFPGRRDIIEAKRRDYFAETPILIDPFEGRDPDFVPLTSSEESRLSNAFEKVMGERPTFLDISFLADGLKCASSVAKLRMLLGYQWYVGTAFLITPDTLLTAYHNLWDDDGNKATEVEVIFDYERTSGGATSEGVKYSSDPATFIGEKADDWAILKISDPQKDRPLMQFARNVPKVGDRVSIIQHPSGNPKQIALHHNLVTYVDNRRIQYLTDTLGGSSGSPVFNGKWEVVALHHQGGDLNLPGTNRTVHRNQGITINQISTRFDVYNLQP